MPEPSDAALYAEVKARVYKEVPAHSAYRSGLLVRRYKAAFAERHGPKKRPYRGDRPTRESGGLPRWFAEAWRNESGGVGYGRGNTLYRPTVRVSPGTPATWGELTEAEVRAARAEKRKTGRVRRFAPPPQASEPTSRSRRRPAKARGTAAR